MKQLQRPFILHAEPSAVRMLPGAVIITAISLLLSFSLAWPVSAAAASMGNHVVPAADQTSPASVTQEIKVTAIVPHHRDIVVSAQGEILSISSNTPQDVVPDVYVGSVSDSTERSLTPELYEQYRKYVPVGTAKYGNLYSKDSLIDTDQPADGSTSAIHSLSALILERP